MLFYIAMLSLGLIGIYKFRAAMLIIQRRNDAKLARQNASVSFAIITEEQKDCNSIYRAG